MGLKQVYEGAFDMICRYKYAAEGCWHIGRMSGALCSVTALFTPVALMSLRLSSLLDVSSPPLPACSPIQKPPTLHIKSGPRIRPRNRISGINIFI